MDLKSRDEGVGRGFLSRAIKSTRQRGIRASVLRILQFLWKYPRARRIKFARESIDSEFDSELGVSTGGVLNLKQFDVVGSTENATAYQAIFPRPFRQVMDQLPIDFGNSTFIDFGSGKGRAILLATEYPFRSIIGVEFAPELHSIAEHNLQAVERKIKNPARVKLLCADAVHLEMPETQIVAFFYNPFGEAVMKPIVRNLESSFSVKPRNIWAIYFWPEAPGTWMESSFSEVSITQPDWPTKSTTKVVRVWRLSSA